MEHRVVDFPRNGHTLGSLLRDKLFANGAEFAACVVPHPQDDFLRVEVRAPDDCIRSSLLEVQREIESARRAVRNYLVHAALASEAEEGA